MAAAAVRGAGGVKGRRALCERAHFSSAAPALHFAPVLADSSLGVSVRLVSAAAATLFCFVFSGGEEKSVRGSRSQVSFSAFKLRIQPDGISFIF